MSIVQIIVLLLVCGVVWRLVGHKVASPWNEMIIVIAVILFGLWLLSAFGIVEVQFRP